MRDEKFLTFNQAAEEMAQADLLLWESGWKPFSFLIGCFGREGLSHAAQLKRAGGDWWIQEVVQWFGGRRRPLKEAIDQEPGKILWYAANAGQRWPEWDPQAAVRRFDGLIGCHYGYWNILKVGLLHIPIIRLLTFGLLRQATDDQAGDNLAPFCSQAVAIAARAGGVDPVPHLADDCTEPADLARSLFYEYRATLVPNPQAPIYLAHH